MSEKQELISAARNFEELSIKLQENAATMAREAAKEKDADKAADLKTKADEAKSLAEAALRLSHDAAEKLDAVQTEQQSEVFDFELKALVRHHVYGAMALGLLPFPVVDMVALMAIELNMARTIANKFGENCFEEEAAKKVITSVLAGLSPLLLAPAAFSLVKLVPVLGPALAGVTMPVLLGAITLVVARVLASNYQRGTDNVQYVKLDKKTLSQWLNEATAEVKAEYKNYLKKLRETPPDQLSCAS